MESFRRCSDTLVGPMGFRQQQQAAAEGGSDDSESPEASVVPIVHPQLCKIHDYFVADSTGLKRLLALPEKVERAYSKCEKVHVDELLFR